MSYSSLCNGHNFNETEIEEIHSIEDLSKCQSKEEVVLVLQALHKVMLNGTFFLSNKGGLPQGSTYHLKFVKKNDVLFVYHSKYLVVVEFAITRFTPKPTEDDWREMFRILGRKCFNMNHYNYLEAVIENFWVSVFGKTLGEMWCDGIITSHGDKCYGYKDDWEEAGIPFERGALLFLLTYTKELGETPKHESCDWVIKNYQQYLPAIQKAEKECLFID